MRTPCGIVLALSLLGAGACARPPDPEDGNAPSPDAGTVEQGSEASPASPNGLPVALSAESYREQRAETEVGGNVTNAAAVGAIVQCATCHGPQGQGKEALRTPRIGGLPEWYLARQLTYFKTGLRGGSEADAHGTQMRAIALPLPEGAIEDLSAHLASLSPPPAPAVKSGDADHGKQLYAVCAACHGTDATGNPATNSPGLVKQSGSYLVRQLEHFRSGVRGSHPQDTFGAQMRPVVQSSVKSRQDAVDIATYIATLREDTRS